MRRAGVLHRRRQADAARRRARADRAGEPGAGAGRDRRWRACTTCRSGALTLTNATEAGAVYGPDEVAALAGDRRGPPGCRCTWTGRASPTRWSALGCTPAELTWKAGVDALSFGGTKNGCLGVEAVMLFDPARGLGVRAAAQARRASLLQAPLPVGADGGLSRRTTSGSSWRARANARAAALARGHRRRCRGRGCCIRPRRTWSSPPGRGAGHRRGAGGGGAVLPLAGRARAWTGRTTSRWRRGWSATGRPPRRRSTGSSASWSGATRRVADARLTTALGVGDRHHVPGARDGAGGRACGTAARDHVEDARRPTGGDAAPAISSTGQAIAGEVGVAHRDGGAGEDRHLARRRPAACAPAM